MDKGGILKRYPNNPILSPTRNYWWESQAVFNCAVLYDGNRINLLYRAIGEYENHVSRIGCASSGDGYTINRRNEIAFDPILEYEQFGIEDPRLSEIEDQIYITYVVLSEHPKAGPQVSTALAAVSKDYLSIERLGIITSEEIDNKDAILLLYIIDDTSFCPSKMEKFISNITDLEKAKKYLGNLIKEGAEKYMTVVVDKIKKRVVC